MLAWGEILAGGAAPGPGPGAGAASDPAKIACFITIAVPTKDMLLVDTSVDKALERRGGHANELLGMAARAASTCLRFGNPRIRLDLPELMIDKQTREGCRCLGFPVRCPVGTGPRVGDSSDDEPEA